MPATRSSCSSDTTGPTSVSGSVGSPMRIGRDRLGQAGHEVVVDAAARRSPGMAAVQSWPEL